MFFQHVAAADRTPQAVPNDPQDSFLSASFNKEDGHTTCFSQSEINKIIQMFPHGDVLQHLDPTG